MLEQLRLLILSICINAVLLVLKITATSKKIRSAFPGGPLKSRSAYAFNKFFTLLHSKKSKLNYLSDHMFLKLIRFNNKLLFYNNTYSWSALKYQEFSTIDKIPVIKTKWPNTDPMPVIIYLHGGSFIAGDPRYQNLLHLELSRLTGCQVIAIKYSRLPENPCLNSDFPAVQETITVYKHLISKNPKQKIVLMGESAGATIACLTAQKIPKNNQLKGLCLISPPLNNDLSRDFWSEDHSYDVMLGDLVSKLTSYIEPLLDDVPLSSYSPYHGEVKELPPTLIFMSKKELLYNDLQAFVDKCQQSNVELEILIEPVLMHVSPIFIATFTEAKQQLQTISQFIINALRK